MKRVFLAVLLTSAVSFADGGEYVNPIYLTVDAGSTNTLAEAIAAYNAANGTAYTVSSFNGGDLAAYTIVKKGDGMLRFNEAISGYTGQIHVEEGRIESSCVNALGNKPTLANAATYANGTFVHSGAAIEMVVQNTDMAVDYEPFQIEGTGPDGQGAYIQRWGTSSTQKEGLPLWPFGSYLTLTNDATILLARSSVRLGSSQVIYPNGRTLTIKGAENLTMPEFFISQGTIAAGGHVIVTNASLRFYYSPTILGNEGDTLTLAKNSKLNYYRAEAASKTRKLIADGGTIAVFYGEGDIPVSENDWTTLTGVNYWNGPVELKQDLKLSNSGSITSPHFAFSGKVSGTGSLMNVDNPNWGSLNLKLHLTSTNNDFTGGVYWKKGQVYLHKGTSLSPNSLGIFATNTTVRLCAAMNDPYVLPGAEFYETTAAQTHSVIGGVGRWTKPFVKKGPGTVNYYSAVGGDLLAVSNGTVRFAKYLPGLSYGIKTYENWRYADYRDKMSYIVTTNSTMLAPEALYQNNLTLWPLYSFGSHRGYIWNNSPTNETWTFAAAMRSWCRLYMDSTTEPFLNHKAAGDNSGFDKSTKSAGTKETITVTPGPHLFTILYGKDSGGRTAMGPFYAANATNFVWADNSGLMLDRQGRDSTNVADYERIEDPGDASLLSLSTNATDALPPFNRLVFASGTTLDLNGHDTYTVCELVGAPTIRNGGLCVTGTLYAAKSDIIANRRLTVDGSFTLAAGANVVVDGLETLPANGKTGQVIVTAAGGVSGEAIACSPEGPVRGWYIRPSSATTLSLYREVGFSLTIR